MPDLILLLSPFITKEESTESARSILLLEPLIVKLEASFFVVLISELFISKINDEEDC